MPPLIKKFARDKAGATAIEYAILASFIALVIIASVGALGNKLPGAFNQAAANLH